MLSIQRIASITSLRSHATSMLLASCSLCTGAAKEGFHTRNKHKFGYNFPLLMEIEPNLQEYVHINKYGIETIDFGNDSALRVLNKALLKESYGIENWTFPEQYLCPGIPSRADYIHNIADLLESFDIDSKKDVIGLDIGVGASCIYPIIGNKEYNWKFIGTDINHIALNSAKNIIIQNDCLKNQIELRLQQSKHNIFQNIIKKSDKITFTMCNPPFFTNLNEAKKVAHRKWKNLNRHEHNKNNNNNDHNENNEINMNENNNYNSNIDDLPLRNFGGVETELCCPGGQANFIVRMIRESAELNVRSNVQVFTTLISKQSLLPLIYRQLECLSTRPIVRTIQCRYGNKKSHIVAWKHTDC